MPILNDILPLGSGGIRMFNTRVKVRCLCVWDLEASHRYITVCTDISLYSYNVCNSKLENVLPTSSSAYNIDNHRAAVNLTCNSCIRHCKYTSTSLNAKYRIIPPLRVLKTTNIIVNH